MRVNKKVNTLLLGNNDALLSSGILLLRLTIGILLFIVGSGKVFGWFGGYGLHATIQFYIKMGIAVPLAYLSCFTEFLGGLLLAFGLFTRPAAVAVVINMAVATITMLPGGFFGASGPGASYPFVFLIMAIVILFTGPMSISLDSLIFKSEKSFGTKKE